jgi:hypothetical protein
VLAVGWGSAVSADDAQIAVTIKARAEAARIRYLADFVVNICSPSLSS